MTTEELQKRRYKCIADFPYTCYRIGEIIGNSFRLNNEEHIEHYCSDYPAIFQRLRWWEERSLKEMPNYVRDDYTVYKLYGVFLEKHDSVWEWAMEAQGEEAKAGFERTYVISNTIQPSTKEEYDIQQRNTESNR